MVGVKIQQHFIVDQPGYAACRKNGGFQAHIRLLHIGKVVVQNNIGPALQAVFRSSFYLRQFCFSCLGHIFCYFLAAFIKIHIKIIGLVKLPFIFFVLHTVFPKCNSAYLRPGKKG